MFTEAQNLILPATLVMAVLVAAELTYCRYRGLNYYRGGDSLCNILIFMGGRLSQPFFAGIIYVAMKWLEARHLFDIPVNGYTTLLAVILTDFAYYWEHRLSHKIAALWFFHEVHHSSRHFNLTTSFRLHWLGRLVAPVFFAPLLIIGFKAEQLVLFLLLNLLYQFILHTRTVGRLGVLEGLVNTPSAHRVHHGRNALYLDKNFGGVLMIWDKLFGTYQAEVETPEFGVLGGFSSDNPITVQFHKLPLWPKLVSAILVLSIVLPVGTAFWLSPAVMRQVETRSGAQVESVVVEHGGHTWPGRPTPILMGIDGFTAMNIDAGEMIGRFFAPTIK